MNDCSKIAQAIALVGLAALAVYLELNGSNGGWLWLGVVLLFLNILD